MPDFDFGIPEGYGEKGAWQSQSSGDERSSHREKSTDAAEPLEERVGRDTQKQLRHLLDISEGSGALSRSRDRG